MNATILSLVCLIAGFLICTFLPENRGIRNYFKPVAYDSDDNTHFILFQRLLVVFFFGFIPLVIIMLSGMSVSDMGLNFNNPAYTLASGFMIGGILVIVNFLNRRNEVNLSMYPVIRKKDWTLSLAALSSLSWIVYLFSYEFLFRGFLLFSMVAESERWNSIVINVVLYSLVHVPKGWKEAVGAIPLGILLCVVCLHAGNIWPAFIAHCCLALSNEWFALAVHPVIHLIKKGRATP